MVFAAVCAYACLACFIGVLGVLAFPGMTVGDFPGDILTALPERSLPSITGRVSLALALTFMVPLLIWPMRASTLNSIAALGLTVTARTPACHTVVTILIIGLTNLVASYLHQVQIVYGLVGSIGGSFIFFIWPSLCYLRCDECRRQPWSGPLRVAAKLLLVFGVLLAILGTYVTAAAGD